MQPFYKDRDFVYVEDSPVDEDIFSRGLCLPSDIKMTEETQARVAEIIKAQF
jgi:dTDP-4-amino-4,6-dideoxygalactose transaminase